MLASIALIAGGGLIAIIGVYFWNHPEQYDRYLHRSSPLAELNVEPPRWLVRFGAGMSVIIGLVVAGWGLGELVR